MVLHVTTVLGYANEEILRSCVMLDEGGVFLVAARGSHRLNIQQPPTP